MAPNFKRRRLTTAHGIWVELVESAYEVAEVVSEAAGLSNRVQKLLSDHGLIHVIPFGMMLGVSGRFLSGVAGEWIVAGQGRLELVIGFTRLFLRR